MLDQRFEFDLVSADKLLQRYVDRPVSLLVNMDGGPLKMDGTLLAARGGSLVIARNGGIDMVPQGSAAITLGELPGGLRTRPTLLWNVNSPKGGRHQIRMGYETSGLTWRSDYNLTLDAAQKKADLSAWVTLLNVCGRSFEGARLKLVAGDVQRVQPRGGGMSRAVPMAKAMMADAEVGFEEKAFADFHLYTLPRPVDVPENASQQIALFPSVSGVPVEKLLVYEGAVALAAAPRGARHGLVGAGAHRWARVRPDRQYQGGHLCAAGEREERRAGHAAACGQDARVPAR